MIYNRPGLPHISYRIGSYTDIRASILHNLNKDAVLRGWTHRLSHDPGIALIEGAAILGDILTFYQELYANEAYLRTAQWRESVADLVRLIGYRLSPAVGGKATFAFDVKGDDPVVIPAGFPVKAQVEGLDTPADFETAKMATAYPALSKFSLYRPMSTGKFDNEVTEFSIETATLEEAGMTLAEGDRLILIKFVSSKIFATQIVVIKEVEEKFNHTNITIEGNWTIEGSWTLEWDWTLEGDWTPGKGRFEIAAYKLGRTFRHFGHNAPLYMVNPNDSSGQLRINYIRKLDDEIVTITDTNDTIEFCSFGRKQLPLDNDVNDLIVGGFLIIGGEFVRIGDQHEATMYLLRKIKSFKSESMTWGSLTGPTAVVDLENDLSNYNECVRYMEADIRKMVIHEAVGEKLTLKPVRKSDLEADGQTLDFYNDGTGYEHFMSRRLIFAKQDGSVFETTGTLGENELSDRGKKKFRKVILGDVLPVDFQLDNFPLSDEPDVTVYGNLVDATQGKTEKEAVLGNGDSREIFQTFKLPKAPLTYHLSLSATPPEAPELEIRVNTIKWTRVPSFFGHEFDEQIYIVREDANGDGWVQFGDGKTGRRLPSGVGNVVAKYRTGVGAHGALKKDTNVQAGDKLKKLDKIYLPGKASGGNEAETGDNARQAAPGKIQSLGRLVSLKDFESEALAISGVSKAKAVWGLTGNIPSIKITVLMETGADKDAKEVGDILSGYDFCRGARRYPIEIVPGKLRDVSLHVTYGLDPSYLAESVEKDIKEALGVSGEEGDGIDGSEGLFDINRREFGQREYATRIAGTVQNVKGVLWADVTKFEILDKQRSDIEAEVLTLSGEIFPSLRRLRSRLGSEVMAEMRVPLYDRLPEIYRIRDEEQKPAGQSRAFLKFEIQDKQQRDIAAEVLTLSGDHLSLVAAAAMPTGECSNG